jgi:DDE_Tnp_1-associated
MLYQILQQIPDLRRKQGQLFELHTILFISIFAIICGATSYREISSFTRIKLKFFKKYLKLKWKRYPAYSTIRKIILSTDHKSLEKAFRNFSSNLPTSLEGKILSIDGKTIRGSFDNFNEQSAVQVLMALLVDEQIILAHKEIINDKTNEIPMLQELIAELGCSDLIITSDALHCQKKL